MAINFNGVSANVNGKQDCLMELRPNCREVNSVTIARANV